LQGWSKGTGRVQVALKRVRDIAIRCAHVFHAVPLHSSTKCALAGLAFGVAWLSGAEATAGSLLCPGTSITIRADNDAAAARICAAAIWTRSFLERCDFQQRRNLTIEVVEELRHPLGVPVIALFDGNSWKIQISTYDVTQSLILPSSVYHRLAPQDVYDSLVVHEVAHALFRERAAGFQLPVTAHEYVAYAIQIASLPPESRELFLSSFPRQTPGGYAMFNDIYLAISPLGFAANAYRHLFRDANPCETLKRIATGKEEFPLPLE